MTLDEIVAAVQEQHDATASQAERWTNERHRRMVAESMWRAIEKPIAATVAGQARYPIEDDLVDLRALKVGDGQYGLASQEQLWALKDPSMPARLTGNGVFAPAFDGTGGAYVELYPVPDVAGTAITGLMAYEPAALAGSDSPIIPVDLHSALLDGVNAEAYVQLDGRWELATPHEQRYEAGIEKLRRRKNSRIGSGPVQAQVQGYHFR